MNENDILEMYKLDPGMYYSGVEGLVRLGEKGYFKDAKLPKDSWGNGFIYLNDDGSIELISLGADKKEGGDESASDIKMSECK